MARAAAGTARRAERHRPHRHAAPDAQRPAAPDHVRGLDCDGQEAVLGVPPPSTPGTSPRWSRPTYGTARSPRMAGGGKPETIICATSTHDQIGYTLGSRVFLLILGFHLAFPARSCRKKYGSGFPWAPGRTLLVNSGDNRFSMAADDAPRPRRCDGEPHAGWTRSHEGAGARGAQRTSRHGAERARRASRRCTDTAHRRTVHAPRAGRRCTRAVRRLQVQRLAHGRGGPYNRRCGPGHRPVVFVVPPPAVRQARLGRSKAA